MAELQSGSIELTPNTTESLLRATILSIDTSNILSCYLLILVMKHSSGEKASEEGRRKQARC
eukprot:scaffold353_cov201-Alexandrium_tamarense.AAC.24